MDSNVTRNIKEVVFVEGALRVPGLASTVAEPNVAFNSHAADVVFTAPWKVTMLSLDATMRLLLSEDLMVRIRDKNPKYDPFIYSITRFLHDFQMKALHTDGIIEPGASAILYIFDANMFKLIKGPVRVVTEGVAIGQTIMPAFQFQSQLPAWK